MALYEWNAYCTDYDGGYEVFGYAISGQFENPADMDSEEQAILAAAFDDALAAGYEEDRIAGMKVGKIY
jgi:hypothetical protein